MLSLPLISPQPDLLHPHHLLRTTRADSPSPRSQAGDGHNTHTRPHQHHQQTQPSQTHSAKSHPHHHAYTLLQADEATIQHRKAAIRNFGSTWIRPPGVPKTLQAMREEEAELAEQEELARQEQGLRDLRARQEVEEARQRGEEAGMGGDGQGDGVVEERDLDDEIPDADVDADAGGADAGDGDVTFNEESLVEGSHILLHADTRQRQQEDEAMQEEAELTGAAQDGEDLGIPHDHERDMEMERDLDDSVPEAGSYQHTDTELEDSSSSSSSEEEEEDEAMRGSPARRSGQRLGRRQPQGRQEQQGELVTPAMGTPPQSSLQSRIRAQQTGAAAGAGGVDEALTRSPGSLNLSSSLLESSFVGDSPVLLRGGGRGGAAAAAAEMRRMRGRGS